MGFAHLFAFGVLELITVIFLKVVFFNTFDITNWLVISIFFVLVTAFTIAYTRRLGTINYAESITISVVWLFAILVGDGLVTGPLIGYTRFQEWPFWLSYFLIPVVIFIFHKKRHVEVRKKLKAK
jgi:hypothetical protein